MECRLRGAGFVACRVFCLGLIGGGFGKFARGSFCLPVCVSTFSGCTPYPVVLGRGNPKL